MSIMGKICVLVILLSLITGVGKSWANSNTDDPKQLRELALKACSVKIEQTCGEKPILPPGEVSETFKSCVSAAVAMLESECRELLEAQSSTGTPRKPPIATFRD